MLKRLLLATGLILSLFLVSCEITIKPLPIPTETPKVDYTLVEPILTFGELATDNETATWTDELGRWKPATAVINGVTKTLSSRYFLSNTIVGRSSTTAGVYLSFEWTTEGAQHHDTACG